MKICAFSDCHGYLDFDIPEADLYLIAGDICPVRDHSSKRQLNWLHSEFKLFLNRLGMEKTFWVCGNHDLVFESHLCSINNSLLDGYLQDSIKEFKGLKIYGTPWQPCFCDWAFNAYEEQLEKKWELIPKGIDILILHGPPHSYGDKVIRHGIIEYTGSPSLLERIKKVKPKLAVFGHIHENGGQVYHLEIENQSITLANVSVLDGNYNLANKPIIFEL